MTYRAAWPLVLGLGGLDYFSTLAYQPSMAVESAGLLAPRWPRPPSSYLHCLGHCRSPGTKKGATICADYHAEGKAKSPGVPSKDDPQGQAFFDKIARELIPVSVYQGLLTVSELQAGRPVAQAGVEHTLPFMPWPWPAWPG